MLDRRGFKPHGSSKINPVETLKSRENGVVSKKAPLMGVEVKGAVGLIPR